ncbi:MAG: ATP:cob(I)alamin adenosyltransferase, partial [Gammaproteobacteria bacterium]|nr:ATP:cob(I)alamin adenosyltransferase [Gammaproteobacteria bacterium]
MPRISKVTTRGGDQGQTKLATGRSVAKHHAIMLALGGVDELNSQIGLLTIDLDSQHATALKSIQ